MTIEEDWNSKCCWNAKYCDTPKIVHQFLIKLNKHLLLYLTLMYLSYRNGIMFTQPIHKFCFSNFLFVTSQ